MDELRALRTFLAVADERSFAAAARRLGATPAAATRQVAALEAALGVQLFVRTTRQVSLTAAGAAYAARVSPLVAGLADAAAELRDEADATVGRIRLNAPMSMGQRVLPEVLTAFQSRYPRLALSAVLTDEFVDILASDCDLAIRISAPPADKSTIWRKICLVDRIFVAGAGSRWAKLSTPEDLSAEDALGYASDGAEEVWTLAREGRRRSLRAGQRLSSNNGEMLAEMAAGGAGVALLPRFIVEKALRSGRLCQVLSGWAPPDIWLTLFYPPYDRLPPRVATFSNFFETYVTETHPLSAVLARTAG